MWLTKLLGTVRAEKGGGRGKHPASKKHKTALIPSTPSSFLPFSQAAALATAGVGLLWWFQERLVSTECCVLK